MLITDLVSKEFSPCYLHSSVEDSLKTIDEYKLTHLPVFEGLSFVGNISEEYLNELPLEEKLTHVKPYLSYFSLAEHSSIFEAINKFYNHDCNIIPVLDENEKYIGYILIEDVIAILSKMPWIAEPTAMMIVSIPAKNFSMSEVTKIVESNNGKIFGSFISRFINETIEITVKFSAENLTSVGETFERFGYQIIHKFFQDEKKELIDNRYEQLMKYLEI